MRIRVSKRTIFSLTVVVSATTALVSSRRTINNLRREKAELEQVLGVLRSLLPPEVFEEDSFELVKATLCDPGLLQRFVYGVSFNRAMTLGNRAMALTKLVEATAKQLSALSAAGNVPYVTLFMARVIIDTYVHELQTLIDAYEDALLKVQITAQELTW